MQTERFKYLMDRLVNKALSDKEREELCTLLNQQEYEPLIDMGVQSWLNEDIAGLQEEEIREEAEHHLQLIFAADKSVQPTENRLNAVRPVHRIHFLRKWGWAAACLLVAAGVAGYLLVRPGTDPTDIHTTTAQHTETILPGKESALLSLADGSKVALDSIRNGVVALQGGITAKVIDGKLVYEGKGKEKLYNTINTPIGCQYQLTLPDGTKVWLNAASSITFPISFVEQERRVAITGEAYFEIARNKSKPFILDINGQSELEVLGTSFNVNCYKGESGIRATLLEGSVKVNSGRQSGILRPGQQATVLAEQQSIRVSSDVNIEQVMAWKNGLFNFEGADVRQVMRQLERWYNIDVKYEGPVPSIEFQGKMYRDVPLSEVLNVLQKAGVQFRMEKRTIVML